MPKRQIKEPIRLREKLLSNGDKSLYLDIYWNGERSYEFLKLYLIAKPKTALEKQRNRETLELAQTIKAQRIVELQHTAHGLIPKAKKKVKLLTYFKMIAEKKNESEGNKGNWLSMYKHLSNYAGDTAVFSDINNKFIEGFRDYLLNAPIGRGGRKLSRNSAYSYFNKFRAGLKQAVIDNIIEKDPSIGIKAIKQPEAQREFLTYEELRRAAMVECEIPVLKDAFLFSALTGLRWSDIQKLTWKDLRSDDKGNWYIRFQQRKTKGEELQPIGKQARDLLGDQEEPGDKVFKGLKYSAWHNIKLQQWMNRADIKKNITFHCARHTYATLQLAMGTDIYTVSKLLGHRELRTTQIYTKVIDEQKRIAADRIPNLKIDDGE